MGFGISGNVDSSSGSSKTTQNIWDPQAQAMEQGYGSAGNLLNQQQRYNNVNQNLVPGAQQQQQDVYNLGMQGQRQQMAGGAFGDQSGTIQNMMDQMNGGQTNTSMMYENIVGGPGNTYIDPMVAAMKTGMEQNRGMMQGANAMDANSMGQGGSSRHAMENAMTNKQINQDMNAAEMGMRGENYDTDMQWKMKIAGLADQNQQSNLDRMYNMVNSGNESQQFAMNNGENQQNLGMGQFAPQMVANATPWQNQQQYANIMGDPTVLTDNVQKTKSSSVGGGFGF